LLFKVVALHQSLENLAFEDEVPSLLTFIKLEEYLEKLLGIRVDLVMESALKPKISKAVHKAVVYII